MKIIELTGTCSAGGALTITDTEEVNGYIEKVVMDYQDGDTGADLVITAEGVISEPLLTITNAGTANITWYPRSLANKVTDASAFTDIAEKIFVGGSSFKVVVAQGGVSKDFRFLFYVSDEV